MIDVYTTDMIKASEEAYISTGVSILALMREAANGLLDSYDYTDKRVAIIVGGGKNGGDGLCLSELLPHADLYVIDDKISHVTRPILDNIIESGREVRRIVDVAPDFAGYDVIVDCIFGTGLTRPVEGIRRSVIRAINDSSAFVISADIPSGLHADTGRIMGECVEADITVSFSPPKVGYYLLDGMDVTGEIVYHRMSIPFGSSYIHRFGEEDIHISPRRRNTHKGTYGKVSIIAGSPRFVGAAILSVEASKAAYRCGAGLVNLCVPYSMREVYQKRVAETILTFLPDVDGAVVFDRLILDDIIDSSDVVAIGMGMGDNPELQRIVAYVLSRARKVILDADGLNCLVGYTDIIKTAIGEVYITPHPKEFTRLFGGSVSTLDHLNDPIRVAREYGINVLLKGSATVVTDGREVYITTIGGPELAKAGNGDVLSGILSAVVSMGYPNPLSCASVIQGKASRRALRNRMESAILASEIVEFIGK